MGKRCTRAAFFLAALATFAGPAKAAVILNIDGNGQLTGAQNVNVNGTLYDFEFVDGRCGAVYEGCNDVTDFAISNSTDALAAVQALFDQVLLDAPRRKFRYGPVTHSWLRDVRGYSLLRHLRCVRTAENRRTDPRISRAQ